MAGRPKSDATTPSHGVTFAEALRFWLRLGLISFGGPAGQIAIMQTELVDRKRWIGQRAFLNGLNFCTLLPGPEAQQLATYIGWRLHGVWGGLAAGLLFVIPGALLLFALSWLAAAHGDTSLVAAAFYGLKPVVIAIVVGAVWRIGRRALKSWQALALAAAAFVAIFFLHIDFPWIVLAAGAIGWIAGRNGAASPFASGGHGKAEDGPTALDHATPVTIHRPVARVIMIVALFLALWAIPVGAAILWAGQEPFADIANLFTKAAFVTFGGAYAVLPYVADEAVRGYAWLSPGEMLDGMALAETTPGPLILVLQYVGFFAGWHNPGAWSPLGSAAIGSALTTYCTFLPCFLFIFVAAPYVHDLHERPRIGSALGAVTAAVVGVILNLAVFLAEGVLAPAGRPDFFAIVLALAAFAALQRWKLEIHWLVVGGAAAGLIWKMLIAV